MQCVDNGPIVLLDALTTVCRRSVPMSYVLPAVCVLCVCVCVCLCVRVYSCERLTLSVVQVSARLEESFFVPPPLPSEKLTLRVSSAPLHVMIRCFDEDSVRGVV